MNSVAMDNAKVWGLPHIHDARLGDSGDAPAWAERALFWEEAIRCGGAVLCIDSYHLVPPDIRERCNLLVLDEGNKVMRHLTHGGTLKERESDILQLFAALAQGVIQRGAIVLSEVKVYQRTLDYVSQLSGCEQFRLFDHQGPDEEKFTIEIDTAHQASGYIGRFLEALSQLPPGRCLAWASSSQINYEVMEHLIKARFPEKKVIRIDGKTNDSGRFKEFWSDSSQYLEAKRPDVLIYSPAAGIGCSLTHPMFNAVWGYSTSDPDDAMQSLGRVRSTIPRHLWIGTVALASAQERLASVKGCKRRLAANLKGFAQMHGVDLAALIGGRSRSGARHRALAPNRSRHPQFPSSRLRGQWCRQGDRPRLFHRVNGAPGPSDQLDGIPD
jgi:hypothetical protein